MIDCHSHILPKFDDGSKSAEMTLQMLNDSMKQGVNKIISTSHCYPKSDEEICRFVNRRNEEFLWLKNKINNTDGDFPEIFPGCELNLTSDVSEYESTRMTCINNTDYILIEMPYTDWKEWMFDTIYKLTVRGYKPVIAHIDRYAKQNKKTLNSLYELDLIYQVNADSFYDIGRMRFLNDLIENKHIHIIGSDMHNTTNRMQCIGHAKDVIIKKYGIEFLNYLDSNAQKVINGDEIDDSIDRDFHKKSLLKRIFIK